MNPEELAKINNQTFNGNPNAGLFSTITSANLTPSPTLQLPENNQPGTGIYTSAASSIPTVENIINEQYSASNASNTYDDFNDRLMGVYDSLSSQGAIIDPTTGKISSAKARQDAEAKVGLPEMNKQLLDLNNQTNALIKEALAIPLQLQQQFEGRGVTAGGLKPIETGLLRQNTIKALSVSALTQAVQGNIALANQQVEKAIELEFADERAELQYLEKALEINKRVLERQDKQRYDLAQAKLKERERLLNEQAQTKTDIRTFANKAAELGLPNDILEKISNSSTYEEAYKYGAPYLAELARTDRRAADALKQLQMDNIRSEIQNRKDTLALQAEKLKWEKDRIAASDKADSEKAKEKQKIEVEGALGISSLINDLRNPKRGFFGLMNTRKWATGFSSAFPTLPGTSTRNYNRTHDQLKSALTLDNLTALRGLGSMSDREFDSIKASATKLSLDLPEDAYLDELNKISKALEPTFQKAIDLGLADPMDIGISLGMGTDDVEDLMDMGLFSTSNSTSSTNFSELFK